MVPDVNRIPTARISTLAALFCVLCLGFLLAQTIPSAAKPVGERVKTDEKIHPPSKATGSTVARIITPTFARYRLGGRRGRLIKPETPWSGKAQHLLVLASATRLGRRWLKVLLPFRPNGNTAWIPRDFVHLTRSPFWVEVGLKDRRVVVYRNGRRLRTMRAVIGAQKTPTPVGLSAVHEINRQPDPRAFLGPWVVSLTSHSNVLMRFETGPARIGIHGRSGASLRDPLGSARSNGCIRITNRHITWMARHLSPGTPVRVRR